VPGRHCAAILTQIALECQVCLGKQTTNLVSDWTNQKFDSGYLSCFFLLPAIDSNILLRKDFRNESTHLFPGYNEFGWCGTSECGEVSML